MPSATLASVHAAIKYATIRAVPGLFEENTGCHQTIASDMNQPAGKTFFAGIRSSYCQYELAYVLHASGSAHQQRGYNVVGCRALTHLLHLGSEACYFSDKRESNSQVLTMCCGLLHSTP